MDETAVMPRGELLQLVSLPPSAELEERVLFLDAAKASGATVHGFQTIAAAQRLEQGRERDRLQAMRPEGCWCLGLGDVDGRTCDCPDGRALQAEREIRGRRRRREDAASFIARAGIPPRYQDASFTPAPPPMRSVVARVREWRPSPTQPGLFLWGDYGTGKTWLAVSVLREYVEREVSAAVFAVVPDLLESIRQGYTRAQDRAVDDDIPAVVRATRAPFLVLDDMGAERPNEWVTEVLYRVVNTRYNELRPTVFTSNLALEGLAPRLGARTTWRIAEMCEFVEVAGANLRAKGAGR